jgi:hypothetical protein
VALAPSCLEWDDPPGPFSPQEQDAVDGVCASYPDHDKQTIPLRRVVDGACIK